MGTDLKLDGASALGLEPCQIKGRKIVPLSFSQRQMWYVCAFRSGTVAYNQPVAWRLNGHLDLPALEQSLNAILRRHEALRTTFPTVAGSPVQSIHDDLSLTLRVIDLTAVPESVRRERVETTVLEEARYPFDLSKELLLRASILQTGPQEFVLIIVVHHIVCDGWSMGVLIRELAQFYRHYAAGGPVPFATAPLQYSDFCAWQREHLRGERLETQLAYWKEQLQDAAVADLPADRRRPLVATFQGASQPFALSSDMTLAFKTLCAQNGVFLFMGLLAVLQLLIHRYTGQSDVVVGAPIAARKKAQHQNSIGLFLNLVALRADFNGDPTFRMLLHAVRDAVMAAYQNQDVPFDRVVEEIHPVRISGRAPLFEVTLDQVDPRWIALDLAEVHSTWMPVDNRTSKFDLTLAWFQSAEGMGGWLEYSTDLFDADTITRLLGHYRTLVESVLANPDLPVSQLAMLTPSERQQLVDWNHTQADYPAYDCIHHLFERQASITPEAIAVQTDHLQISYQALNDRANQLAHRLSRLGAGPDTIVGVCLDRSPELMVALLGILKAGSAYLPFDPVYPHERLAFMLKDADVKILVTDGRWAEALPTDELTVVHLSRDKEQLAGENSQNLNIQTSPDDLAYVIYTSGSTGQPKGVLGLHRGAVNRFAWMWKTYPFEPGEATCAKTSLNFVDSVWELFGPLLGGIPTLMISDEMVKSPQKLIASLEKHRVTRLVLVPSLLRVLLEQEPEIASRLSGLKYWICSGEAIDADLVRRFREALPNRILLNLYGSSEVSADVTYCEIHEMGIDGPISVGRPIANTETYIVDKNLQLVPIGVPGLLCIGGVSLARGYLKRPVETDSKFVDNPFTKNRGERMYLTGDLARYRPDGTIQLLGRMDGDHQVKIRGFRIELGEIESLLREHSCVRQAVVISKNGPTGERGLAAYILQKEGTDTAHLVSHLRTYLRERLPEFMVPATFQVLPVFPLLPNGKIDRCCLADFQPSENRVQKAEILTNTEARIRQAWLEVLHVDQISIDDNFFDVGGHSLLLAAVQTNLESAFDRQIASVDLYRYPSIRALAKHLDDGNVEQRPLQAVWDRARRQKDSLVRRREIATARPK